MDAEGQTRAEHGIKTVADRECCERTKSCGSSLCTWAFCDLPRGAMEITPRRRRPGDSVRVMLAIRSGLLYLEMIVFDILGYFCRFFPFTFFSSSFDILWQNCSLEGKVFRRGKNLGLSTHFCYSDHNGKVDERALHPRLRKASEIPSMKVGIALSIRVLGK